MDILDKIWSMYEICGVSMLDISVWKWMYAHPNATAGELQEAVIRLSKEIWNKYYAPVFGVKDETVLAIYSHMIKDFANEVSRIFKQGRLTPNVWIKQATGNDLTVDPMLEALRKVLKD